MLIFINFDTSTFTSFNVFGEHDISFYGKFWDCYVTFGFWVLLLLYVVLILLSN